MTAAAYQARLATPFAVLGIRTEAGRLSRIDFLPPGASVCAPRDDFTAEVVAQIEAYLRDPAFAFSLPLSAAGTAHQCRVWQQLARIPCGQAWTYGELARRIGSAARAVGQACGANPIPIVIPCHRVVARNGLGGFMGHGDGDPLAIKRWLLRHEGWFA